MQAAGNKQRTLVKTRKALATTKRLAFTLLPAALLLLFAEAVVRVVGVPSAVEAHGPLGWTALPELQNERMCTGMGQSLCFSVDTNADGLRTELGRARTEGIRRAMVVGESTVFGWGTDGSDTIAAALEKFLGPDWEVVNAGQPGYSSEQVARLAAAAVPAYRPDVVIWFQPWNDIRDSPRTDRAALPEHPAELQGRPWWKRSHLLLALRQVRKEPGVVQSASPAFAFNVKGTETNEPLAVAVRVPPEHRHENLARTKALVEAHGGILVGGLLPRGQHAAQPGEELHPVERNLVASCQELGLTCRSLTTVTAHWSELHGTLPADPGHFTAKANRAFAARLVPMLLERTREVEAAQGSPD